jgi:hypothetical protein
VTDSIFEDQRRAYEANQVAWENAMNGARADKRGYLRGSERQKLDRERRQAATTEKPKTWAGVFESMTDKQRRAAFDALEPLVFKGAEPVTDETYLESEPDFEPDSYEDFYGDES